MKSERITEYLVNDHFQQFSDLAIIEPQKSENPSINKFFRNASKKGVGRGFPEFIITIKGYPNLVLIIECKSDASRHESETREKYGDYAVDGVLLYSSFLSKEYDVIGIAVSGTEKNKLRISHFLQLKGEREAAPIFGNELLAIDSYTDGYQKSPQKFKQDYYRLLEFTKDLNETLHHYKISEDQRALLISCILIALEDNSFRVSYPLVGTVVDKDDEDTVKRKKKNAPKELAELLVNTVINQLKSASVDGDRIGNLEIQFSFIRTHTSLTSDTDILKGVIRSIDSNINSFIKTHEYFDVLSQLYIGFLQYANSDKALGIVLTPPHITELFAEIANVNKNSIVYDNCTGTAGFLISSMRKMILDANGNKEKIKEIKKSQLIGVEYDSKIFALAVSNMYIHQDGKTNIFQDDCFKPHIVEQVSKLKPNVGMLNPPYKANKKKDTEELEFVLNNLDCLEHHGICLAIIPMQCALSSKMENNKSRKLKEVILSRHTLEAVMSMPDELFANSKASVVSCIMVFSAHTPHPPNKKTYFGYWKDDGFVKRKIKGRIDYHNKWEGIKSNWLDSYINRQTIPGLSVMKNVKAGDEWCAEAYMETDYSTINEMDFKGYTLNYFSFLLTNKLNTL